MKKFLLLAVAATTLVACQQKKAETEAPAEAAPVAEALVLEGPVPAADGPGYKYNLEMAADSTYKLVETALEADNGKDKVSEFSGKAEAVVGTKDGMEVHGLKFAMGDANNLYLVQKDDSTFRMVNDKLEEAASGLNYDLKKVK